jgi:signal transduction histidine kinase
MSDVASVHLPAFFSRLPAVVLLVSSDGVVAESNGVLEKELGRTIVGHPFTDVLDADACGEKWKRVLATSREGSASTVCELVLSNDETVLGPRPFSVLWDADGNVVWLMEHPTDPRMDGVRREVTEVNSELANAQRELVRERGRLADALTDTERSNRLLDEFAHAVSHDLKAPLRSVANYARWIEEDVGHVLTGEARGHMDLLRAQVERMRAMINGVLDYSRSGRTRAEQEVVDVNELLAEVIALLDPPSSVTIEITTELPSLVTGRTPLRQVLLNLISNAIKHSRRDDARVQIGARDVGDAYEFHVRDNGPGIPVRAQEKIWALFHTLTPREATASSPAEGTGVGLAIVRQLVEVQGGRVWVESQEGSGATFRFLWPKFVE